jgi:transcriptional regulator with XRE-family HTH domain
VEPTIDQVRTELREILETSGMSNRQLSLAMGRDTGYVSALLDPSRPSRARPTPADLERLSDATNIPLTNLLERVWGISSSRLAEELSRGELSKTVRDRIPDLTDDEMRDVVGYVDYVIRTRKGGGG